MLRRTTGIFLLLFSFHGWTQTIDSSAAADTAFIMIAGELPQTLYNKNKPYLVAGDINVAPGVTVTIEPGVVLLFKDFTGLQVHGTLLAGGTKDRPIVFTSDNDRTYVKSSLPAAPYDWNGITIDNNAFGTSFKWCTIQFSLFGINALTKSISIESCTFFRNGKSDLILDGKSMSVGDIPFSLNATEHPAQPSPAALPKTRQAAQGRIVIRVSSLAVAAAGCALGVLENIQFSKSDAKLRGLDDFSAHASDPGVSQQWESAREQRNNDLTGMLIGYGLLAAAGLTITFFW